MYSKYYSIDKKFIFVRQILKMLLNSLFSFFSHRPLWTFESRCATNHQVVPIGAHVPESSSSHIEKTLTLTIKPSKFGSQKHLEFRFELVVVVVLVDGDHKKLLLAHRGDGVWNIRSSELRRSERQEARPHRPLHGQARRREVPQAQAKGRRWLTLRFHLVYSREDAVFYATRFLLFLKQF